MTKKVDSAKADAALEPLKAIHKIVYGEDLRAKAGSIFWPTSAKERQEILDLEAGRELDDVEKLVAAQMKPPVVAEKPKVPADAPKAAEGGEDFQ